MSTSPDITIRDAANPASILGVIQYVYSQIGTNFLPVLLGQNSLPIKIRFYNNYALNSNIASAMNVNITTYDGVGVHTSSTPPVSQAWVRVYESGYGESKGAPGLYTAFPGSDTAVGGVVSQGAFYNVYNIEVGSDGAYDGLVRAGADSNSTGFVEITTYASVPLAASMGQWNFALTMNYEWTP